MKTRKFLAGFLAIVMFLTSTIADLPLTAFASVLDPVTEEEVCEYLSTHINSEYVNKVSSLSNRDVARELMEFLGYDRWENFHKAIERAIDSCKTAETEPLDHFRGVTKMVQLGSGAERGIKDYMLTRYACYLTAQNGDHRKEEIAFAQSYFAVQTRK